MLNITHLDWTCEPRVWSHHIFLLALSFRLALLLSHSHYLYLHTAACGRKQYPVLGLLQL